MQMNSLRTELNILLAELKTKRPPALRRSRQEEWLYNTDLPGLCKEEELKRGLRILEEAGWETSTDREWLHVRKAAEEPPDGWYNGDFGPEAACCLSLLDRHKTNGENGEAVQRMLIKAGEEGGKAYESACALLHSLWAEKLRKKDRLPAVSRKYFGA